ncbi:MAG: MFS transporter [Nocardioides sp.]|uniref:MFS transporter n=1 Tax=Nocardioides sp. TaxID=35761 RepID=UPI0039E33CFD
MSSALRSARTGSAMVFAANGALFASFVSRLPDIRSALALSNGGLGLLLLCAAAGSVAALPFAGPVVTRFGPTVVVRVATVVCATALFLAAVFVVTGVVWLVAVMLAGYGCTMSTWDVAMNVEGAEVERRLRRTTLPQLHAMFSLGSVAGALVGVPMAALQLPLPVHLAGAAVLVTALSLSGTRAYLAERPRPASQAPTEHGEAARPGSGRSAFAAWREPRTVLLGVMVFAFAAVEGSANDWLTLAVIDGYDTPHWVGVAAYSTFVVAMTLGRLLGARAVDRFGRAPMLWGCTVCAFVGILTVVYGGRLALAFPAIVVWGIGGALGFPVGLGAAADDGARAAARVGVVSTIGYTAFLAFPPLLGALGDRVGTLDSLVVIACLMLPAAITVTAARPPRVADSLVR